jgi:transaldolase
MDRVSPFAQLREIGQSLWLDNLSRDMIAGGELARLVASGDATGITTNPSIFRNAIAAGKAYAAELGALKASEPDPERRYERLAVADVQAACDVMRRLRAEVARDNVLIKIPGTPEGAQAFERCIAEGISVNITLLFSLGQMNRVFEAYIAGLAKRHAAGGDVSRVKAVASFFMSRIDSLLDKQLDAQGSPEALALRGRAAVAIGKLAYERYGQVFGGSAFAALRRAGARPQYLLWASTSTKNPAYPDLLYVEPLIGPETINTLPDATLAAFRDHGKAASTIGQGVAESREAVTSLERLGVDLEQVGLQLQRDGVRLFEEAYDALLAAVN